MVSDGDRARHQVLDHLALLVDKSLVVAENVSGPTRYRLLEDVRQYALEKLGESREAVAVRHRHRDHYTALAASTGRSAQYQSELLVDQAETEIDNLRAAFAWSLKTPIPKAHCELGASLRPFWLTRGRIREGSDWLEPALADAEIDGAVVAPAAMARALADKAFLDNMRDTESLARAQRSLVIARELDDPVLLGRTLTACGRVAGYDASRPGRICRKRPTWPKP